jgi:hypothetical protein
LTPFVSFVGGRIILRDKYILLTKSSGNVEVKRATTDEQSAT